MSLFNENNNYDDDYCDLILGIYFILYYNIIFYYLIHLLFKSLIKVMIMEWLIIQNIEEELSMVLLI